MTSQVYSLAMVSEETGELISSAVRTFADTKGLYYDLWHKGAPIWVITDLDWLKSNIGPRVNKLEVGVFHTDNSLGIVVLPDAYQIEKGQRRSISSTSRRDLSQRVSFNKFLDAINIDRVSGAYETLGPVLEKAWRSLVKIKDEEFTSPGEP